MKDAANSLSSTKLLVGAGSDFLRERTVVLPKVRRWRDAALGAKAGGFDRHARRPKRAGTLYPGIRPRGRIGDECRSEAGSVAQAMRITLRLRAG